MARVFLRRLAETGPVERACALVERLDSANTRILRVLTYHRVDEGEPFARQIEHLRAAYQVVSVARVLTALEGGPALPPRAVLLTFDDAYKSFAEVAWPILEARDLSAALFVPTAYPGGHEPRFWWDRLAEAFARGPRRAPLETPLGTLALETADERARAHGSVKRWVKDLPHARALAATDELCAAMGLAPEAHEVLDWDELRSLARAGVTLGAHSRTHPRLDRVERAQAHEEILGSIRDLEREVPGQPRVFAYPDGRFDDELVELARAAGVELAFTTRRGVNDVFACDRLRLRRVNVDARDSLAILRAKLALSAARLEPLNRVLDPPTSGERGARSAARRENRRSRFVLRPLDAALTARLRPDSGALEDLRRVLAPRTAHYERVGRVVHRAVGAAPALGRRLERTLLDTARLPVLGGELELAAFGSGSTVFRLRAGPPGSPGHALKIYRRTLGRSPAHLAAAARRYRERYRRLREVFGEVVLPASFLVLHAPLRGLPAVACLQPWLAGPTQDLLALGEREQLALLRAHGLGEGFATFVRRLLAWGAQGYFPDLTGCGNLVLVAERGHTCLRLIDYGVFHPDAPASSRARADLEVRVRRLEALLGRLGSDVVHA